MSLYGVEFEYITVIYRICQLIKKLTLIQVRTAIHQ